jgi:siroheme synthase
VENASLDNEQRIFTTLAGLTASALKLAGPAVLCVGEVFAVSAATPAHEISADHQSRMRQLHASRCQSANGR